MHSIQLAEREELRLQHEMEDMLEWAERFEREGNRRMAEYALKSACDYEKLLKRHRRKMRE